MNTTPTFMKSCPLICPGEASIRAAVNPDGYSTSTSVAKGDGSHAFARTYREHQPTSGNTYRTIGMQTQPFTEGTASGRDHD